MHLIHPLLVRIIHEYFSINRGMCIALAKAILYLLTLCREFNNRYLGDVIATKRAEQISLRNNNVSVVKRGCKLNL